MVMLSLQCAIVGQAGSTFDVEIDDDQKVSKLKKAIKAENTVTITCDAKDLQLFLAKKDEGRGAWLTDAEVTHGMIDISGLTLLKVAAAPLSLVGYTEIDVRIQVTMEDVVAGNVPVHVLVKLPDLDASIPIVSLPRTTALNDPEKFAEECISLHEWDTQAVHEIPSICRFMRDLGGCTNRGKMFWRMEDRQIVSLLLDGWFGESYPELADKSSIVIGSPGIGKSTLLCVMAFHLVFKHKKNVLVYRRLGRRGDCLLYLGYENGKVVQFAVPECKEAKASDIYDELVRRQGKSNVWLLIDGFRYREISRGLLAFEMLATSQQVDLKSGEQEDAYCCLLPCWSKNDLFAMGALIYKYVREDMRHRFYYSGGSVREFILATSDDIRNRIDNAISSVGDVSNLLSKHFCVSTEGSQVDRIRHTFINDTDDIGIRSFTTRRCWEQVIDSKYAALVLAMRLSSDALYRIYTWAKHVQNRSLARGVFEMYIHRLAADNKLELYISEYDPPEKRSNKSRHFEGHQVRLKNGGALCRGTAKEHETVLINWRDDARYSYWFPRCNNFPNIDSIVKLESGNVAYLQFTVAAKHGIDAGQLRKMNSIFPNHVSDAGNTERPIYIAVCPDLESRKALVLDSSGVHNARQVCRVYVGYFAENPFGTASDSSLTEKLVESWPPPLKYNLRKRPRTD